MSRGAMQDVELDEGTEDVVPVPAPPARRRLRWWWFAGAAAVVVAALVVVQGVIDRRERAELDRLAATPGVLRPVDESVGVLWRPDAAAVTVLQQRIDVAGAALGLALADDGSQAFVALDLLSGEQRFRTPLVGPDPTRARTLDRSAAGRCVPVPSTSAPPVRQAACLVSDGFVQYGDEGVETRKPPTSTRVVVLDTGDGHVVADVPAPGATTLAAVPGLAVVGVPGADDRSEVLALDLGTGQVRWRFTPPLPGADRRAFAGEVRVFAVDGLVGVTIPGWTATVLSSTGQVLRASQPGDADHLVDPVAGRLVLLTSTGSGGLRSTLVQRGRADVDLPGAVLPLAVDDGSLPGLVLTSGGNVRGWDAATGDARWTSDVVASVNALVLDGTVYLSTQAGVVALDGRSGAVVWRAATVEGTVPGSVATDGRHLLAAEQPVVGDAASQLVAYALDDGRTLWRVPLPDRLRSTVAVDHLLIGWGGDGGLAVLG